MAVRWILSSKLQNVTSPLAGKGDAALQSQLPLNVLWPSPLTDQVSSLFFS
jgi:hypothetical protein